MSMDGLEGFDELIKTMDELGDIGKKVGRKGIKKALEATLPTVKEIAPKDSGEAVNNLSIGTIKTYQGGSVWGGVGINAKNWDKTKSLYFQHYGFKHYKDGKLVEPHKGWMDKAVEASAPKAIGILENEIRQELDKILK